MQDGEERQLNYQQVLQVEEVAVGRHWLSEHEWQPGCQREANDDQSDGLSHPMVIGGQVREISGPIPEMEETAGLNTWERCPVYQQNVVGRSNDLNHPILNGLEDVSREESSIQEPVHVSL